jgi:hypothetical protein
MMNGPTKEAGFLSFLFFWLGEVVVLGFELRASHLLGGCSTT